MLRSLVAALLPLLSLTAQAPSETVRGEHLRVAVTGAPGTVQTLRQLGFGEHDLSVRTETRFEVAEVLLPRSELAALRRALPRRTMIAVLEQSRPYREISTALAAAFGPDMPDPNYRTPAEVLQGLQGIEQTYPNLAKVYDLQSRYGAPLTHDGNVIHVMRISDNPTVDENEPNLLVFANNHSRELNSIEAPFLVADQLLTNYGVDPQLTQLVDENQIWILPNMNPDGLDYVWNSNNFWRKNRRDNGDGSHGVDLNRNYRYFWGQCGSSGRPSSDTYRGPAAGSEPETLAMELFTDTEGFERLIDIHSFSRDVRIPFNPLVISSVPSWLRDGYDSIHSDIANAMNYLTRTTCCCGTHMEWHHASNGTLAFLVEMGTAFQPAFPDTQSELTRMWPGLREFLTRPVPLRGQIRSLAGNTPIVATVSVPSDPFLDGQEIRSGGRFGRYQFWADDGSYTLRFEAPGHVAKDVPVVLQNGQTLVQDVWLEPTAAPTTLTTTGTPRLGATVNLDIDSPDDGGRQYFLPFGFATSPGIPVGAGREIPIAPSGLLDVQLAVPSVFVNTFGTLDANGRATGQFIVPNNPGLVGIDLWVAGVTLDTSWFLLGVKGISAPQLLRITN